MSRDNTTRFSNRVDDYVRYRPEYPLEIIDFLQETFGLTTDKIVADVGAGTGIATAMLLNAGYRVYAVEPNREMREKAVALLHSYPGFTMYSGTAEHTELEVHSVDAVLVFQAFHWFDVEKTRMEFKRILKPGGITAIIWNERKLTSGFEKEYDALIVKYAIDYVPADKRFSTEQVRPFFDPEPFEYKVFGYRQEFDFEGLRGRLQSSSYMPTKDDGGYEAMINDLKLLFDKHQQDGMIAIDYDTKVYAGR